MIPPQYGHIAPQNHSPQPCTSRCSGKSGRADPFAPLSIGRLSSRTALPEVDPPAQVIDGVPDRAADPHGPKLATHSQRVDGALRYREHPGSVALRDQQCWWCIGLAAKGTNGGFSGHGAPPFGVGVAPVDQVRGAGCGRSPRAVQSRLQSPPEWPAGDRSAVVECSCGGAYTSHDNYPVCRMPDVCRCSDFRRKARSNFGVAEVCWTFSSGGYFF